MLALTDRARAQAGIKKGGSIAPPPLDYRAELVVVSLMVAALQVALNR